MSWLLAVLLSTFVGGPAPDCVIVEFMVDNCGPCRQLQPALEKLKGEGWEIRTVNANDEPELIRKHAIDSLPTLVLISNGKEVDRIVGAAPYEKILPRLAKLLLASNARTDTKTNAKTNTKTLSNSNSQLDAALVNPQAPTQLDRGQLDRGQLSRTQLGRSEPAAAADNWQSSQPSKLNLPESGITVRGQSPVGAFPMLAGAIGSLNAASPSSQAIAEGFEKLSAPESSRTSPSRNHLASNATRASDANPEPMISRQPDRIPAQTVQLQPLARNAAPIDLQTAISRAEAATVRIRVDEENSTAYGTGTVIDVHGDEALVLTCGHLFREMKLHSQLTIDLFAGRSQPINIPAQLIDFKADAGDVDIGLISFRLPFAIEPIPLLPQSEALSVKQPAFSFGCDHGENPTRRDTQIKSINRYMGAPNVEIAGAPAVGRSGGGLFDNQGRLIGVCNAADAEGDEGIYAAAGIVYAQIDRLGLSHLFDPNPALANPAVSSPSVPSVPAQFASQTPAFLAAEEPAAAENSSSPANLSAATALTCIVRDANGREQVVQVNSPSHELLDAIHRQASGSIIR